jgi:hypothetical protein
MHEALFEHMMHTIHAPRTAMLWLIRASVIGARAL